MIIPSLDISNGKVVQWRRGREPVLERDDPENLARCFGRHGEVAVIDLDAALGKGENTELVCRLCRIAPCRVGGGIRTVEHARYLLKAGARRLIIGTRATPDFLSRFPRSMILAALDEYDGELVDQGWRRHRGISATHRIDQLRPYVSGFVYTTVDREGTLCGADFKRFRFFAKTAGIPVTAAGGVASIRDVVKLDRMGMDCQVGLALYTGKIDLTEAFVQCVQWGDEEELIPVVVRDLAGRTRMLAYTNPEALRATLRTGQAHFWSRSRGQLWRKGEESGNVLHVHTVRPDCDRDALLMVARPSGPTCHLGKNSCFDDDTFTLFDLEEVLRERILSGPENSWTRYLSQNPHLLQEKLLEEAGELAEANEENDIVHEAADLLYHAMTWLAVRGVSLSRILSELNGRRTWDSPSKECKE